LANSGITILWAGVGNIEPDEEAIEAKKEGEPVQEKDVAISVVRQRVASWQAKWQRRAVEREADGEAKAIRIVEHARAQALAELVNAVEEGFRELEAHDNAAQPGHVIALSFINAVEQMLSSPDLPEALEGTGGAQATIEDVRRLIQSSGD
jgi:regulator of protease activity HflC (stomatin/prohibitin superfamily)